MNLNSTNISYILKRLSCCITNLSSKMYGYSQIGNKDCFENTRNNILILNSIYDILEDNYNITYPLYKLNFSIPFNPTVCACTIIDNNTGNIIATGYNTASTGSTPTSNIAFGTAFNNLNTLNPCYTGNVTFDKGSIKGSPVYTNVTYTIVNSCSCLDSLTIHLFVPYVNAPPYTGIDPTIVVQELGTFNLSNTFTPGSCSNKECFTTEQLNTLYQESLNICKDCNCN